MLILGIDSSLLQYKELCSLAAPAKTDLALLREWLTQAECGDNFLEGVERNVYPHYKHLDATGHKSFNDLVSLSPHENVANMFSLRIMNRIEAWFHLRFGIRLKVRNSATDDRLWTQLTLYRSLLTSRVASTSIQSFLRSVCRV